MPVTGAATREAAKPTVRARTRGLSSMHFGFDMAQPDRRYDVTPVTRAEAYLVPNRRCIGGRGVQESWIRRQVWNTGHENGWLRCGRRGAHVMRRRWEHRGTGIPITLSKPTTHADGVPADLHEVGSASGDSQSDSDETESRTLIEPANRGADIPSRTDSDAIGDEESLAVADPRGDHHDPDSHCSAESVDCHPVGDYQPIADCQPVADRQPVADCQPVAVLVRGGRVCGDRRSFLVLVGAGGLVACSRGSDSPSRAGTPSTSLED